MRRIKGHIRTIFYRFVAVQAVLCCGILLSGQTNDTIQLNTLEIAAPKSPSGNILQADTLVLKHFAGAGVEDILAKFSPVFIKRTAAGGSVMASYQGFSPAQVPVLWNGFPSASGMTGVTDLSLYSRGSTQSLSWGNNTLEAQGITDALSMEQGWSGDSLSVQAGFTAGSFGLVNGQAHLQKLFPGAGLQTSASYIRARNEYPVTDYTVNPAAEIRMTHAGYEKLVLAQGWKYNDRQGKHFLTGALEGYYNDREIPPSLVSPGNRAAQRDGGLRSMVNWKYYAGRWQNEIKTAYFFTRLIYDDLSLVQNSDNTGQQWWLSEKATVSWNNTFTTEAGADMGWGAVESNNYSGSPTEWQVAPFLSQQVHIRPWLQVSAKIKGYFIQSFQPGVAGRLAVSGRVTRQFLLYYFTEVKRTTRFPTLNDRYWNPGGNPDIDQENAWVVEVGFKIKEHQTSSGLRVNVLLKGFHIRAKDLIFWFPGNKIYWTPQNLQEVFSTGAEADAQLSWTHRDWTFSTGVTYQLTAITNRKSLSAGDNSVGKQLIYLPKHMAKWYALLAWKGLSLLTDMQFYDKRYITTDNNSYLPGYMQLNLQAGYSHTFRSDHQLQAIFSIGNLSNTTYEEVAYRPMPGIHFSGTIIYQFNPHK